MAMDVLIYREETVGSGMKLMTGALHFYGVYNPGGYTLDLEKYFKDLHVFTVELFNQNFFVIYDRAKKNLKIYIRDYSTNGYPPEYPQALLGNFYVPFLCAGWGAGKETEGT